ncbi:LPS assembly lipoprotein LptE [Methylotenera sp.]|uniref:LPS-assembly lipoprotein LptE n=1 Tax=Methylotenera sp. TaxID=2051956 RepID=UPI002736F468|nr:LPS assembly lipoprotein LptE [Methylotenera sp.]MDP3778325.1 LPS assembly lipoprotein LptE [Methylotenera sp.]
MQYLNLTFTRHLSWVILATMLISACGFQLRGTAPLSFTKLHLQGAELSIKKDLKRALEVNGVKVVDQAEEAEMLLELVNETSEKRILSLSGGGLVREFELYYSVNFRTRAQNNPLWGRTQTIQIRRDFSYNDNALLGKAEEEAGLNLDMRKESVRAIVRRLSATNPEQ